VLEKCEALKDAYYGTLDAEENLESCELVLQTLMLEQSDLNSLMAMAIHIKQGIAIPKILEKHGFRLDGSLFFKKKFPISPAIEPQEEL
jgi:hypothetical protein